MPVEHVLEAKETAFRFGNDNVQRSGHKVWIPTWAGKHMVKICLYVVGITTPLLLSKRWAKDLRGQLNYDNDTIHFSHR